MGGRSLGGNGEGQLPREQEEDSPGQRGWGDDQGSGGERQPGEKRGTRRPGERLGRGSQERCGVLGTKVQAEERWDAGCVQRALAR